MSNMSPLHVFTNQAAALLRQALRNGTGPASGSPQLEAYTAAVRAEYAPDLDALLTTYVELLIEPVSALLPQTAAAIVDYALHLARVEAFDLGMARAAEWEQLAGEARDAGVPEEAIFASKQSYVDAQLAGLDGATMGEAR